ncbi:MAG: PAS domain S-box protein [Desulfobacula sp.]|jgi:PAS domain S-box-containing protein
MKNPEETLETYRTFIDNSPLLFYRIDMEGRVSYVSSSVYSLSGYTVEETVGKISAKDVCLLPEEWKVFLVTLREKGHVENYEARLKRKDGSVWWASTNAYVFRDREGKILGVEGITRDISELKRVDEDLRESEERFRLAFHTSPDSINLNRVVDGMYIDINEGFTELTGYTRDDVSGKTSLDINIWKRPEDRARLVEGLKKNGHVKNLEAQFVSKKGEVGIGLMSARILSVKGENVILSVTRDITDLKQAQEMMVQSEKMLSIGGLAAGMAHEINNPLAGMMQNAELMIRRLTDTRLPANRDIAEELGLDTDILKAYLEKRGILDMAETIKTSGIRIADIVRNMLSFARKSDIRQVSSHSIAVLLDQTLVLAGTDFDLKKHYDFRKIQILKQYQEEIPLVPCEAAKIQQVFLNLLSNGAQAMQEAGILHPVFILRAGFDREKNMVFAEIEDNGPGMDEKTQKRIFEPFFTTKPAGVGTGLGLSVSYFIITKDHGGEIRVESKPSLGTKFIVRLPL